jgi:signal transduction histidine kinase/ActR/RegA family two-component response regulator
MQKGPSRRRTGWARLSLLLLSFGLPAGAAAQPVVLQLQWDNQFQFAGYYAALWQGYYREAGFEQVEIRSAFPPEGGALRNPVAEVAEGRAQFGTSNAGILLARAAGRPVTVVASVFQQSGTRLYFRRETPISSPADLVRLKLGRNEGNELLDVELRAMLAAEGIDPQQIAVVRFPPNRVLAELAAGTYDMVFGYSLSAPWEAREIGMALGELRPADYGIAFYGDSLFTHADLVRREPEMVRRFREASLRGWRYALDNPEEIARRISAELPRTLPLQDRLGFDLFQAEGVRQLTLYPIVALGNTNPDRWERMFAQLRRAGVVEGTLDLGDFLYDPQRTEAERRERQRAMLLWALAAAGLVLLAVGGLSLFLRRAVALARAELERSQAALLRAQKLEAVGQMTGGIAHDFNNLLQVVSSGLSLLERDTTPQARRQEIRRTMRQALDRGARISRQLLVFARRQALLSERVDAAEQLRGMRSLIAGALRPDIELRLELPAETLPVELDSVQFEVALLNLAVNARDAMPRGGRFVVRAEARRLAEPAGLADGLRGEFVAVEVTDTGTGMAPDVMVRVFEPFFTTKPLGHGTGLGLAQVYGFARQSGGTVRIASRPGEGTVVTLLLPRGGEMAPGARVEPAAVEAPSGEGLSVLLVEDDANVALLLTESVEALGHRVTYAAGAEAALAALESGQRIDAVVTDVMMPGGMGGVDLAQTIRARRPALPVILVTGYGERLEEVQAVGLPVLRKPFRVEELDALLRSEAELSAGVPT